MSRFAETSCSQCGRAFGPGDSGYSHCDQHASAEIETRKPWDDGINSKTLWTSRGRWNKSLRNDALWFQIVEARKELIAKALAWRDAAIADGWVSAPTYQHEDERMAFSLHKHGYHALGLARPANEHTTGTGSIACWGPDGMSIPVGETYDWYEIQRGLTTCHNCKATNVETHRYSFAGRCCEKCLPEMRRIHERPGWCD